MLGFIRVARKFTTILLMKGNKVAETTLFPKSLTTVVVVTSIPVPSRCLRCVVVSVTSVAPPATCSRSTVVPCHTVSQLPHCVPHACSKRSQLSAVPPKLI